MPRSRLSPVHVVENLDVDCFVNKGLEILNLIR